MFLRRNRISVGKSVIHGWGVFADQDIAPGELIEECYVISLGTQTIGNIRDYQWGTDIYEVGLKDDEKFLPLGFGSIYNHNDEPNAQVSCNAKEPIMVFTARLPIKRGEEIFISYGDRYFANKNQKPIQKRISFRIKAFLRYIGLGANGTNLS